MNTLHCFYCNKQWMQWKEKRLCRCQPWWRMRGSRAPFTRPHPNPNYDFYDSDVDANEHEEYDAPGEEYLTYGVVFRSAAMSTCKISVPPAILIYPQSAMESARMLRPLTIGKRIMLSQTIRCAWSVVPTTY